MCETSLVNGEPAGVAGTKDLVTRLRHWSSPWPSTRSHIVAVLALAVASSSFAAYVQDAWPTWHYIGHSLVLWIIVATVAAVRGSWLQSWLTTSAVLFVAVMSYFIAVRTFGPFEYPSLLSPLLLFWIVLAVVGGLGFATICLTAVNPGQLSWAAIGTIAGLLLGDAINASIGIPFAERTEPVKALLSIADNPGPVLIIGSIAALLWTATMIVHRRHHLGLTWLIVPGVLVGFVLVTIPDFLLHFA